MFRSSANPVGELTTKLTKAADMAFSGRELSNAQILEIAKPRTGLPDEVNEWRETNRARLVESVQTLGYARDVARQNHLPYFWSQLWIRVKRAGSDEWLPYGLAGVKVVTTAGVNAIVDAFQNTFELETFRYHALGTSNTAEAIGDTALGTEITTEYEVDNTRPTGTLAEGATANVFQTVGTNNVDGTVAAVEHGVLDQASNAGGTLLDRTVFAVINMTGGDSLETTYELTVGAGS